MTTQRGPTKALADMTLPERQRYFSALAAWLDGVLPAGPGRNGRALYGLLVIDECGVAQYLSNVVRADMVEVLRETAGRLERGETW